MNTTTPRLREHLLADLLLDDDNCAAYVRAVLTFRREHGIHRPVTTLRSIR